MKGLLVVLALVQTHDPSSPTPGGSPAKTMADYPFAVGETFNYSVKMGMLNLGSASMSVAQLDTIRGIETFLFRFTLEGGVLGYRLNTVMNSWVGTSDFISRRFRKDADEDGKERHSHYEIFPDSGFYRLNDQDAALATPDRPLDDAAFFYFLRMMPLEVGKTYQYHQYFRKEKNPLTVKVLKKERMELPGGRKVECLLLHPVIQTRGLLSERSDARFWVTADSLRVPVQIRSKFPFGTITLRLTEIKVPDNPPYPGG